MEETIIYLLNGISSRLKFLKHTCITKNLILFYFYRKANIDAVFYIGVKVDNPGGNDIPDNDMRGHAWLKKQGEFLFEEDASQSMQYEVILTVSNP